MLTEKLLPPEVEIFSLLETKNPKLPFQHQKVFTLTSWKKRPEEKNQERNQPNDDFPKDIFNPYLSYFTLFD